MTILVTSQIDAVARPSWQAQISGRKKWTFSPVPECDGICAKEYEVIVEKGDISKYVGMFHTLHVAVL